PRRGATSHQNERPHGEKEQTQAVEIITERLGAILRSEDYHGSNLPPLPNQIVRCLRPDPGIVNFPFCFGGCLNGASANRFQNILGFNAGSSPWSVLIHNPCRKAAAGFHPRNPVSR